MITIVVLKLPQGVEIVSENIVLNQQCSYVPVQSLVTHKKEKRKLPLSLGCRLFVIDGNYYDGNV